MVSLILGLPDWMTKTSFSRTLVMILTLVSPCGARWPCSVMWCWQRPTLASGGMPKNEDGPTYIGELGELGDARRHPQVLTYLGSEIRTGCAGEYYRVPHGLCEWEGRTEA